MSSLASLSGDGGSAEQTVAAENTAAAAARNFLPETPNERESHSTGSTLVPPNFGPKSLYAVTAKVAGRLNATAVSDEEHAALLDERQTLLDKKFSGIITRQEQNRLSYIRWSLDRIEDAKFGASLDVLEEHVEQFEGLLSELAKFRRQVDRLSDRKR